jgi:hypothetical protein
MEEYVEKLNIIDPEWTLKEPQEAKDKCWVSVSRSMVQAENFIEDEDKTLINWIQDGNVEKVDQILWKTPYLGKQALEDGMFFLNFKKNLGFFEKFEKSLKNIALLFYIRIPIFIKISTKSCNKSSNRKIQFFLIHFNQNKKYLILKSKSLFSNVIFNQIKI